MKTMGTFVRSHKRTEMLAYFESVPGSVFDLADEAGEPGRLPAIHHDARLTSRRSASRSAAAAGVILASSASR